MQILLGRGNDLTEFFWPILHFVKEQILANGQVPLWNSLFLAGTPLVSDPQAPIFYPLNLLALIMPIGHFFLTSIILHIVISGVAMYYCSLKGFKFSQKTSAILTLLYMFTPRVGAYLEAGHVGLIYSLAWIPFALLSAIKLKTKPDINHSILFAVSLALIYFSHLPTFLIVSVAFGLFALNRKSIRGLILSALITFGLTAVSLLPQIAWQPYSTRYLIEVTKEVYPIWLSALETIKALLIANPDTEKAIVLGIIPITLALSGLLKFNKNKKLLVVTLSALLFLVVLNNASPIYELLLSQNWYLLLRVSTRVFILPTLLSIYLIGITLEKYKGKFVYALGILGIIESVYWGLTYLAKPIVVNPNLAPNEVYEYLASDESIFRVYCLSRCLSQKVSSEYELELLDGYSTVQQINFYKHAWQLTGDYWNYYTLSIPPFGASTMSPDIKSLGKYSVKYVISKATISDRDLILRKNIDGYLIYENSLAVPRNYEIYRPNFIRVRIGEPTEQLIIPEVYSPGWIAKLDGIKETVVLETPNATRAVNVRLETEFVDFIYYPKSFRYGLLITLTTIAGTLVFLFRRRIKKMIKGKTSNLFRFSRNLFNDK